MIELLKQQNRVFFLSTEHTSYQFGVMETGHLEHLYYGRKINVSGGMDALVEKKAFAPGNTNLYDAAHKNFSLEDICLEMSSYGKGDIREPFVEVVHADGSSTSDFLFDHAEITEEKPAEAGGLPGSYDESGKVEHLCVTLRD